jgi:hypothetical protein
VAFKWDLDEERRGQLIEECSSSRNSSNSMFNSNHGAGGHQSQSGDDFPSAEVLDMSLDLFFRRFHQLLPFIHQQTFTAKSANISVVNAMCLIGLALLDPQNKKSFVTMQLPVSPLSSYHFQGANGNEREQSNAVEWNWPGHGNPTRQLSSCQHSVVVSCF